MSTLESLHRSSGDHSIVWEIVYAYTMYHRAGGIENDDYVSHQTREQKTIHIIAPTMALARAVYDHKYPAQCDYQFVHINPVCTIDHIMTIEKGWLS